MNLSAREGIPMNDKQPVSQMAYFRARDALADLFQQRPPPGQAKTPKKSPKKTG